MLDDRVAKLSDSHKKCLRLADTGLVSKEIAVALSLSHRTVDQYLYEACRILGAENRRDAARIFAEIEAAGDFNRFQLKPVAVEIPSNSGISEERTEQRGTEPKPLGLPPIGGPLNDLTLSQRFLAIGKITLFLTITVLVVIILFAAALQALSH
jgi:DNA-binding CsgD family transcriptional regulator